MRGAPRATLAGVRIALALPPLTQLNTPYPAVSYLARFLRAQGLACTQWDLGLALVLRALSARGLAEVFDAIQARADQGEGLPEPAWQALALRDQHQAIIEPVVRFLQGRDRTLASRLVGPGLLPPGPRLDGADPLAFGAAALDDRARHRATLYVEDLFDLIASTLDPGFTISHYQHHLAVGETSFAPLAARLATTTLVDGWLDELVDQRLDAHPELQVLGLSVPFPGTLYGALRIGRRARARGLYVIMGGGYVNTELREVDPPAEGNSRGDSLWDCVDALTYDDGEGPLLALLEHLDGGPDRRHRTRTRHGLHQAPAPRPPMTAAAWTGDLDLSVYLQLVDSTNPAHRLWGDGRWNKITLAHGCYWRRCAFCDVQLDYIARYEPARVEALVQTMAEVVQETGQSGFHLVDEAAPPRLLRDLALALLARRLPVTFWGNIRFESTFTPDLCRLLAHAGLVMVTGGLEVASDRLLTLMDKGITVEQAARAGQAFRGAGVRVHAYLMYGFPTQTEQETVDSLELVRQMFAAGVLDSGFWHRFVLTRHSAVAAAPERFSVQVLPPAPGRFAQNDLSHRDPVGADPDRFEGLLEPPLHAWMRGQELDRPVRSWLPRGLPAPTEAPDRIQRALQPPDEARGDRLVWLGGEPLQVEGGLVLFGQGPPVPVQAHEDAADWLCEVIDAARPDQPPLSWAEVEPTFPGGAKARRSLLRAARQAGLVRV